MNIDEDHIKIDSNMFNCPLNLPFTLYVNHEFSMPNDKFISGTKSISERKFTRKSQGILTHFCFYSVENGAKYNV